MAWLYKQKGSDKWWIGYRMNGKQFLRSTKTEDRGEAEKELHRLNAIDSAHRAGSLTEEFFRALTNTVATNDTLRGYIKQWLAECKDLSPVTLTRYRVTMEEFCVHLGATETAPLLRDLKPGSISAFLRAKRAQTSTATAKLYRKIISAFFGYCVDNQVLQVSPVPSSKSLKLTKESESTRRAFDMAELKTMFEKSPSEFWRYMLLAGFYCGQRMGDLISLPWGAVDFDQHMIRLNARKTGKAMKIPMHPRLETFLADLMTKTGAVKPADPVWPEQADRYERLGAGPFSNEFYDDVLLPAGLVPRRSKHKVAGKSADQRKGNAVSFHCLRHTFVTMLKMSGSTQAVAKELAGHSSDAVSDLYTHAPVEALREGIGGLAVIG